jgi:hypothetical protein
MSSKPGSTFTRRQLLQAGAMAGTGLASAAVCTQRRSARRR